MSAPFIVELPWPPSPLSPNARVDRHVKANATTAYRDACYKAARAAIGVRVLEHPDAEFVIDMLCHPPTKRRRDRDNIVSATKALRDGLADALGVNDRQFRVGDVTNGEVKAWGAIVVTVREAQETRSAVAATGADRSAVGQSNTEAS